MKNTWNLPQYKRRWGDVCAILPMYLDNGVNGTEVTYLDGSVEQVRRRLCWVLDDLLGYLRSSKTILTRQSCRVLYGGEIKGRRVPLVLSPRFNLVPVKGREARGSDDLMGYLVLYHMSTFMPSEKGTMVQFKSEVTIDVYDSIYTFSKNVEKTQRVALEMCA